MQKNKFTNTTAKATKETKETKKVKGGFNLAPLISAILLAGIKLSLEQKKKNKKLVENSKTSKRKSTPKTK